MNSIVNHNELPLSRAEFEARLRQVGVERYHDKHRFHDRLHSGGFTSASSR